MLQALIPTSIYAIQPLYIIGELYPLVDAETTPRSFDNPEPVHPLAHSPRQLLSKGFDPAFRLSL